MNEFFGNRVNPSEPEDVNNIIKRFGAVQHFIFAEHNKHVFDPADDASIVRQPQQADGQWALGPQTGTVFEFFNERASATRKESVRPAVRSSSTVQDITATFTWPCQSTI